ncbi:MAG: hypothetical protein JSS60_01045 [Verrucomicrobia bacterium]|nr:hypothetical protein [Verrucomicrobiota bacterium]
MNKKLLLPGLLLCSCATAIGAQKTPVSQAPDDRVNFPSNFQVENGWNLFVFGDYLYWTANEDGLYFAQTGLGADNSLNFDGKIKRIDPEWESGARVGAGINFPKEGYDLQFTWTWFSADGDESAHAENGTLLPLWAVPESVPFAAAKAHGKWDLDLNVLDLEWGRSSWFGGHFSLRPFFGLRGAWIDQDLKNHFVYASSPVTTGHLHSDSDFRGGGLRAGCNARFALPHGFALYGLASGALLYGEINAGLRVQEGDHLIARTRDHFWKGISSLQLGLGMGWDSHFAKDRLHIEFHVGYEQNIWFTVNQMNHFMNQLSSGYYFKENSNLSTQGLVAGGRFDF